MKGNFHARFSGGNDVVIRRSYPTMLISVQKLPGSRVSFAGEGRETVKALLISDNRHVRGLGKKNRAAQWVPGCWIKA